MARTGRISYYSTNPRHLQLAVFVPGNGKDMETISVELRPADAPVLRALLEALEAQDDC